jgi:hypothetical protein
MAYETGEAKKPCRVKKRRQTAEVTITPMVLYTFDIHISCERDFLQRISKVKREPHAQMQPPKKW